METLEEFQGELSNQGKDVLMEEVMTEIDKVASRVVSPSIMDADYVVLEKSFYFRPKERKKAGSLPMFSVVGPVLQYSFSVSDDGKVIEKDRTDMVEVSLKILATIDHEKYEIMAETGLLGDIKNPFGISMSSQYWENDALTESKTRLL